MLLVQRICDLFNLIESESLVDGDRGRLTILAVFIVGSSEAIDDRRVHEIRGEVLNGQLLELLSIQLGFISQELDYDAETIAQVQNRVNVVFVDEADRFEKE